ncbi:MAG: hypothetical protein F9K29_19340 [Hyphomicrobiaceae bacterium]|nr:MAG: hypothetical protein F9K29_19340 [Hyphomicrobiaceae bacterium]
MRSGFLVVVAVVSIVYAIGLVATPAWVNEIHGVPSGPGTSLLSRYFGASLLGVGAMAWLARNAADSDALVAFMRGGLVLSGVGLLVSLHAMLTGLMNEIGWVPVVIQALFTLGFLYFAFMKRATG